MEGGHQRDIPLLDQPQRFPARGKGAVGVGNVKIKHGNAPAVMVIHDGGTCLVLGGGGHLEAGVVDQLKGIGAPVAGVVHGGGDGHLMAHLCQRFRIGHCHPTHAVNDGQEGIRYLGNAHGSS